MTVIRGATTIACDSAEEIRAAVAELLGQIESRNALKRDEVLSIVFSSTSISILFIRQRRRGRPALPAVRFFRHKNRKLTGAWLFASAL